jgi:hypothetical protein
MGINSFAAANRIEAAIYKQQGTLGPIPLPAGVTTSISATDLWVTEANFYGYKTVFQTAAPTNNVANIAIGPYVSGIAKLVDVVIPGGKLTYSPALGTKFNLKDIAASGSGTDAVFVTYIQ